MLQTPPPSIPFDPNQPGPYVVAFGIVVVIGLTIVLFPFARAWARRLAHRGGDADALQELGELRARVGELEADRARLAELEERLDFAERLLAQREPVARLHEGAP